MKAPYSPEAQAALHDGRYDRALRRLVKRRRAFSSATPYAMGVIGVADSYVYHNGRLLYVFGDRPEKRLHILDLQSATNQEVVVNVPKLIAFSIPESDNCRKYTFRAMYYAAGITTCLLSYARPTSQNWLLIFNAQEQQLIDAIQLDSTIRLFVRNNHKSLVFGTHSEYDANGNRKWVFRHYNLESRQLSRDKMVMSNLVGYEVGSAVCFEIFDNCLYGCSNQTSFELEEIDWTSYYYCFRIPLDDFDNEKTEIMNKKDAFRRQHREGPIDDRWTFLTLSQDEETGTIKLTECRREWLNGGSENRRTYYIKDVRFRSSTSEPEEPESVSREGVNGNDPWPDERLALLISSSNRPNFFNKSSERLPHEFHCGDYGPSMVSRSKTYLSSYSHSCATFLDLIDDPHPLDPNTQRLRIRTGSKAGHSSATMQNAHNGPQDEQLARLETGRAQRNIVSVWPPDAALQKSKARAEILQRLNQAMNPAELRGSVTAAGDGRLIIYSTSQGGSNAMKVLVVLSFDPATRLAGMIRAGGTGSQIMSDHASGVDHHKDAARLIGEAESADSETFLPCRDDHDAQSTASSTGSRVSIISRSEKQNLRPPSRTADETSWATIEDAMHHQFPAKYDFSYS